MSSDGAWKIASLSDVVLRQSSDARLVCNLHKISLTLCQIWNSSYYCYSGVIFPVHTLCLFAGIWWICWGSFKSTALSIRYNITRRASFTYTMYVMYLIPHEQQNAILIRSPYHMRLHLGMLWNPVHKISYRLLKPWRFALLPRSQHQDTDRRPDIRFTLPRIGKTLSEGGFI